MGHRSEIKTLPRRSYLHWCFPDSGGVRESCGGRGKTANLLLGPQGGFREFSMEIGNDVEKLTVRINQDQRKLWHDLMEPLVRKLKIEVVERRLPSSRRKRK